MHRLGASVVGFSDSANTSLGKRAKRWPIPFRLSALTSMRCDASSAGRCGAPGHRVFRQCPVLNAGDGSNQHPTQTLLDFSLFRKPRGVWTISTSQWLVTEIWPHRSLPDSGVSEVRRQRFYFIAPDALAMPQYILDMLMKKGSHGVCTALLKK